MRCGSKRVGLHFAHRNASPDGRWQGQEETQQMLIMVSEVAEYKQMRGVILTSNN